MGNGAVSHEGNYNPDDILNEKPSDNLSKKPVSLTPKGNDLNEFSNKNGEFSGSSAKGIQETKQSTSRQESKKQEPVENIPKQDIETQSLSKQESSHQNDNQSVANYSTANRSKGKNKSTQPPDDDNMSEVSGSDDLEPLDVLLQFIPYYGQGDPANDSMVRSTLTSLSVEDIDSKDQYGNTLLLLACQYRCEDLVRIMLNKGADPNAVNSSGACCLHFACYRESASYNITKILLQNGANPDIAETTFGCTPLHYCAGNGDVEFCKLLLSYGALINAYDYYSYTCVDYAREAGFDDAADFLQKRLDKVNNQNNMRNNYTSSKGNKLGSFSNKPASSYEDMSEWESHIDPDSGAKYFINLKSGECLWESELKLRIQQVQQQPVTSALQPKPSSVNVVEEKEKEIKLNEAKLISQATLACLIVFFTKHDPSRLIEADTLVENYKGKEDTLLSELCAQYNAVADIEVKTFQDKLKELRQDNTPTPQVVSQNVNVIVNDINKVDPLVLQDFEQNIRRKYESQIEDEKNIIKKKFDQTLEEEKTNYRQNISEKEGLIAKLQTQLDTLVQGKIDLEDQITRIKNNLESKQISEGNELDKLEAELMQSKEENSLLKQQINNIQQELNYEREKLNSLEVTLSNLTAGKEELIAREKAAAEERAELQRQREAQFNQDIQDLEQKQKQIEFKLKSDFNNAKSEWIRNEKELKNQYDTLKRNKEKEIESLRKELADRKAQFAQEMSAAMLQIQDFKSLADNATQRAEEAEHYQKMVQDELAEAKVIQKYNAQLHKDLFREQNLRKKLHNEMEDMKGKIRVYVRIRPFSSSEMERNCQDAVLKDGKMSVVVKGVGGPDQKKVYDFDQVFGGSEGNSQTDVFKDTKHLMLSVIDGFNVCIFAYGQTGAGKSYTMIGSADIGTCMNENGEFDENAGITPRAVSEIFRLLNERTAQVDSIVEVQMFQLYRDGLEDLLKEKKRKKKDDDDDGKKDAPLKITLAEHSSTGLVYVEGAEIMTATNPAEVMKIFAKGSARRTTASTQMNAESSRSHLICSLTIKLINKRTGSQSVGKLTLVDLAGSERVDKSGASGEQLKEAQSINKSLSALGDVIAALTSNQQHVPYRNHPLTMLMSDSIGGNAKTLMFVNTSPADYNANESNSSLAFASRCKDITNAVASGPGVQAAQINALKKELAKIKKGGGGKAAPPMAALMRPDTANAGRK